MRARRILAATIAILPLRAEAACLSAEEAQQHVGESVCVCGIVASAHYAPQTKRHVTFLNLDQPYPRQVFTGIIFGEDRSNFGEPEKTLLKKHVCLSGKIELYRDKPEIILREADQLKEQ